MIDTFFLSFFFPKLIIIRNVEEVFVSYFNNKVISVIILMLVYAYTYNYASITNSVVVYSSSPSTPKILLQVLQNYRNG